mgnify:CR=1 FL=1
MYEVLIERGVERDLKRLPLREFKRIVRAMKDLARDPRPSGSRKLVGSERDWRLRVGDYRVLYEIEDAGKIVRVLHAKHRREAYR